MNDQAKPVDTEYIPPGALEAISRAEIDIAISTARKYPQHSPDKLAMVKQNMMSFALLDEETSQSCFYSLPRGGKVIQGPSVRLAEIAVACYGNLRAGTRIIETVIDGPDPHVVVQAVAMDLEKNIQVSIEKRRRITKKKSKDRPDEDDVNLATNACSAIAFRDSVYKVIPMALIKPVFEAAKRVAVGDARTLGDRRLRCFDTFAKMGIQKDRVLAKLEKKTIEEVNLEDLEMLIGLYTALKDGEAQIDEVFPAQTKGPEPTAHQKATATTAPATAQPPQPQPAQQATATQPAKTPEPEDDVPMGETATAPPKAPESPQDSPQPAQSPQTAAAQETPQPTPAAAQEAAPAAPVQPPIEPSNDPALNPQQGDSDAVLSIKTILRQAGIPFAQFRAFLLTKKLIKEQQPDLRALSASRADAINTSVSGWLEEIKKVAV